MGKVRDAAERLWTGVDSTVELNPLLTFHGLEEMHSGLAFVSSFANVVAVVTGAGLVLVDTGSFLTGKMVAEQIGAWRRDRIHTAVYTHGHIDHVGGIRAFESGGERIHVIGHEAVPGRFDRYRATAGYNGRINARQFGMPGLRWPTEYRYPDETYRDSLELEIGGVAFQLHHDRGETDDHTWVWLPESRTLCTGDLFIWASPNCGNPQKVQRYPLEWARALERMNELGADMLLPGHGPPILGADRVARALSDTATLLRTIHDQTVALMNQGVALDRILRAVTVPEELLSRPYLRPIYDQPNFIVRNIWRLYGGWYDGNPARLEPPADDELAAEVAALTGGAAALAERAERLARGGRLELAGQLVEWAFSVAPDEPAVRQARCEVYRHRARDATSLMARSIYNAAANESVK